MRPHRPNPLMYACTSLEGEFNYADALLVPLGSLDIVGITPAQRSSWEPHGTYAWVIGPAMKYHRCLSFHAPKTKGIITVDTFRWCKKHVQTS